MRRLLAAAGLASLIALSACGSDTPDVESEPTTTETAATSPSPEGTDTAAPGTESPEPEESPTPEITPASDLSGVEVVDGDLPELKFDTPWGIDETQTKVLKEGESAQTLADNSVVTINYMGVNGTTGDVFDNSYERGTSATFSLEQVVPGFQKGLSGQKVGSRVLIGMVPEDGYAQGNPAANIEEGTSLLFLVDIISSNFTEAVGEEVAPAEGMPTVNLTDGKPTVTIPDGVPAPTELRAQPLIKGPGDEVKAESTIQVQYRAFNYADGELWQDAWAPQSGKLSGLIEGWKQGLVGQTAGSRMLLVVPPALAFPDGQPKADPPLEAGQTLVYVIDILDVQD